MALPKTNILFFDLPTTLGVATSQNTWKVRLVLNYKRLSYRTQWVETSDLEATLRALDIPPTTTKPNGDPKWTLPALIDYTVSPPALLADSTPIIEYLERTYPPPDPALGLFRGGTRALHALFEHHLATRISAKMTPLMVGYMYAAKSARDKADFEARLGVGPDALMLPPGEEREARWAEVRAEFGVLAGVWEKGKSGGGVFIMGERPALTDFALGGLLMSWRHASPEDAWARVTEWDGGRWAEFAKALEEWAITPA
ncbi:hypothetical protein PLICRDRAFT_115162 [Plicaturopsis crispa FD-325 SS-3]|nr:hypothetical protein PLICRDRAFT_115162 [Plicaturopsis crispa FD-325 SS-3]